MLNPNDNNNGEWIMLNVGGKIFTTTRTTLCTNEPNSMLARMFSQNFNHYHRLQISDNIDEKDGQNTETTTTTTKSNITTSSGTNNEQVAAISDHHTITLKPSPRDSSGAYLIDRSPKYFEPILNYLRHGKLIIDHDVNIQGVLEEAKFYGIVSLLPRLELETERWFKKRHHELIKSRQMYDHHNNLQLGTQFNNNDICGNSNNNNNNNNNNCNRNCNDISDLMNCGADGTQLQTMPAFTRQDVIKAIISTSAHTRELRFQGCNLAGANLSKLDLRYINFKYANLRNSNLEGANLSFANLERADLCQSNLEGAQLIGTNLSFCNLESSNLRAITIVDASDNLQEHNSTRGANFQQANLRNTNFEGSRMVQVNLRMANLKGSNLQNCDLTKAILIGADMENCDLSGSDLNEANLRKANLKGAQYELEVS